MIIIIFLLLLLLFGRIRKIYAVFTVVFVCCECAVSLLFFGFCALAVIPIQTAGEKIAISFGDLNVV